MIRAALDLGTNTALMLVAEVEPAGRDGRHRITRERADFSRIVRLGQGVDAARALHPDAMARTLECLREYARELTRLGGKPAEAVCVATAQVCDAANGAEFFARVERETGFAFQTISGDEEARLSFEGGLLPDLDPARTAVIDIGGGSTELMSVRSGQSLRMGSVRFTERFLKSNPVTDPEFWACQEAIDQALEPLSEWRAGLPPDTSLLAVAGTATTLATWFSGEKKFSPAAINATFLSRGDLHRQVEDLKWRTTQERIDELDIEAARADVLLAGAMILWRTCEKLNFPGCRVSTRGLRYGALLSAR